MKCKATLMNVALWITITTAQAQLVTLNRDSADIATYLKDINEQTGTDYRIDPRLIANAGKVSIHVTNWPLLKVLPLLNKDQPFYLKINETSTIVMEAKEPVVKRKVKRINVWTTIVNQYYEPVENVLAEHEETGQRALSNSRGMFYLSRVLPFTLVRLTSDNIESSSFYIKDEPSMPIQVVQKKRILPAVQVIHIGYPQVTKQTFTGSVIVLTADDMKLRPAPNVTANLEGLVPSLLLVRNRTPGIYQAKYFTLGASTTVYANPNPLIVVDNFPFEGELTDLNPDDIEDITVLRDAAASALWGARAGNGVIVITTRSGKFNRPLRVTFNSYISLGSEPDVYYAYRTSAKDRVTVDSFLTKNNYYRRLESNPAHPALPPIAEYFYNNSLTDNLLDSLRSHDVRKDIDRLFYRRSFRQHFSTQLSGGNTEFAYQLSLGYDHTLPEIKGGQEDRYNLTLNNSWRPMPGLEISGTLSHTQARHFNIDGIPETPVSYSDLAYPDGQPVPQIYLRRKKFIDTAGTGGSSASKLLDWKYYPATEFNTRHRTYYDKDTRVQASIRYQKFPSFLQGLEAAIYGQYQMATYQFEEIKDRNSFFVRDLVNSYTQVNGSQIDHPIPFGPILDSYTSKYATLNLRYLLTYNRKWSNLNELHFMAGRDRITSTGHFSRDYIYNYSSNQAAGQNNLDYTTPYSQYYFPTLELPVPYNATAKAIVNNYYSYYANGSFGLRDKYIVSGSFRIDKSNIYGAETNLRKVPLYSIGAVWKAHQEKWYRLRCIQELKIRGSYGITGNSPQNINAIQTIRMAGVNEYGDMMSFINNPALPSLRWEKVHLLNFGLQFQSYHKIIEGSIDWYYKTSKDLIGLQITDPTSGMTSFNGNVGSMVSKNIDVVLSTRNINRLFQWRTKLLFSYVKDYITNTQDVLQPAWAYCDPTRFPVVPNRPRYGVYSFPFTGLDIDGQPMGLNKNKDYTSMVTVPGYSTLIFHGRATPAVFGSITNEFSWKQFNLSVSLFYKLDYYFREPSVFYPGIFDGSSPTTADFQKRWQKPGDEKTTYVPRMIFPPNNNRDNFYVYSSILVKRADNIKLQNIHLSYDFEGNALRKLRLRMANIYFNASNMGIIWRMKKSTIDPDYINGFREPAMLTLGFKGTFR